MIYNEKITTIYFIVDEFFKEFNSALKDYALKDPKMKTRNRKSALYQSEVMTIMILFHYGAFKNLKHFYQGYVQRHMKKEFPVTVSYNRFVELQKKVNVPMAVFVKMMCLGKCTDISFIDSTPIRACHIKREKQHKTFKNIAQKGQCSLGWFYGFKLHLIINDRGEMLDFILTTGNVDDREPLKSMELHKRIFGKLFGDKGYIGEDLFEQLL